MKTGEQRARGLVERMLREAAAATGYAARGQGPFFDVRTPEIRDATELRVLHLAETATRLGASFRRANPRIPWEELERTRNDLVHEYPEVRADRLWKFVRGELPALVARLRGAKYPAGEE